MQITLSIDDGSKEDMKIAKLCLKYGVKAVFYWPVDMYGLSIQKGWDSLSPKDEEWIADNFEIGSHTISHRYLTQISLKDAIDEITESKKMLQLKYKKPISKFAYPRGYSNDALCTVVEQAGYEYGRSTQIGFIGEPDNPYFASTAVHIGCPVRDEYTGTNWFDYGLKLLKQARKENKDFEGWCHGWEISKYHCWDEVEKFIKELARG
jgi:peptidoglycan-N-acetylglucosamine deacetylase